MFSLFNKSNFKKLKKPLIIFLLLKIVLIDPLMFPLSSSSKINQAKAEPISASALYFALSASELGTASSGIAPILGPIALAAFLLAKFLPGLLDGTPPFEDVVKNDIQDTKSDLNNEHQKACNQNDKLLNIVTDLSNLKKSDPSFSSISSKNTVYMAINEALDISEAAADRVDDFIRDLSPNGSKSSLDTQAARGLAYTTSDGDLEVELGENNEEKYKNGFKIQKFISSNKQSLKQQASIKSHAALSIIFETLPNEMENIFNLDVTELAKLKNLSDKNLKDLKDEKRALNKLLEAYRRVQNHNDYTLEVVNAFIDNEFKELGISKLSDFLEEENNRKTITSYTQRLLQDLGVFGDSNQTTGVFSTDQINTLKQITPSMSADVYPNDLKYVKDLAYKARGIFVGLTYDKLLINTDREDGYNHFSGVLIGNLLQSVPNGRFKYIDIINLLKAGKLNSEIIQTILSSSTSLKRNELDQLLEKLPNKMVEQIVELLPGDRRKDAIDDLFKIINVLKTSTSIKSDNRLLKNVQITEALLLGLNQIKIYLDNKEDYLGIAFDEPRAKRTTLKRVLKSKTTRVSNTILSKGTDVNFNKNRLFKILESDLDLNLKKQIVAFSAIAIGRGYKQGLQKMEKFDNDNDEVQNTLNAKSRSVNRRLKKIMELIDLGHTSNSKPLQKQIRKLSKLASVKTIANKKEIEYILDMDVDDLDEITPNNTISEFKTYLLDQIEEDLNPVGEKTIETNKRSWLLVYVNEDLLKIQLQGKTIKDIIYSTFAVDLKKKVFKYEGLIAEIKNKESYDWIIPVDENGENGIIKIDEDELLDDDLEGRNFTRFEHELKRTNVIKLFKDKRLPQKDLYRLAQLGLISYEIIDEPDNLKKLQGGVSCNKYKLPDKELPKNQEFKLKVETFIDPATMILESIDLKFTPKPDNIPIAMDFPRIDMINHESYVLQLELKELPELNSLYSYSGIASKVNGGYKYSLNASVINDLKTNTWKYVERIPHTVGEPIPIANVAKEVSKLKLNGRIITTGILKGLGQSAAIVLAEQILEEVYKEILRATLEEHGYLDDQIKIALDEYENPLLEPVSACFITPSVIKKGDKARVTYFTYNATRVNVDAEPNDKFDRELAPFHSSFEIMPGKNTTIEVTAINMLGFDKAKCSLTVDDENPNLIIAKADNQFFFGKDENNSPKIWAHDVKFNVMSGTSTHTVTFNPFNGLSEPVYVPQNTSFTSDLQVNNIPTIMNSGIASSNINYVHHNGGVFRYYTRSVTLLDINLSQSILPSSFGDLYEKNPPLGSGVYLTDLNINPTTLASKLTIAKILRIFEDIDFETLKNTPVSDIYTHTLASDRDSFIDLIIDKKKKNILDDVRFKNQFLHPNLSIFFNEPGVNKVKEQAF